MSLHTDKIKGAKNFALDILNIFRYTFYSSYIDHILHNLWILRASIRPTFP